MTRSVALFAGAVLCGACAARGPAPPTAAVLARAPWAMPRLNFFHAALEVPPLGTAAPAAPGDVWLRLASNHARSNAENRRGRVKNDFDGLFHEWLVLEGGWGAAPETELSLRAAVSGWDEHLDRLEVFDDRGRILPRNENKTFYGLGKSARHVNLSDLVLGLKRRVFREEAQDVDVAAALSVKLPVGRPLDLTNAGTLDVTATLLASAPLAGGRLHVNTGAGWPLTGQNLFVREARIDLNPFVYGGVGLVWPLPGDWSMGVQLGGHTSAFREVRFLRRAAGNLLFGLRRRFGATLLEAAVGTGLDWRTSYQWGFLLAVTRVF